MNELKVSKLIDATGRKIGEDYYLVVSTGEMAKRSELVQTNEVGIFIWDLIPSDGVLFSELLKHIEKEYNITNEDIETEISEYLHDLANAGLLSITLS